VYSSVLFLWCNLLQGEVRVTTGMMNIFVGGQYMFTFLVFSQPPCFLVTQGTVSLDTEKYGVNDDKEGFLIKNSHVLKSQRSCTHEQGMKYIFTSKIQITCFCRL
jgi:hypothetical protein